MEAVTQMNLSFETLVTTFIASSFLFLIACIVFISSRRIRTVGYQALTFICVLSVIRLIIPVEFFFSKNLRSRKILSCVIAVFRKLYTIVSQIPISVCIWQILLFIWSIGSIFHIYGYIRNYKKDKMLICYLGKEVSEQKKYSDVMAKVCKLYGISHKFKIYEMPGILSPAIFSFSSPTILLPINNNYTIHELNFIFRHEIGHFVHHHLIYQFLIDIFVAVYWWNPFNKFIKKQIDTLLEMSIDNKLSTNVQETTEYLQCLLNVSKQTVEKRAFLSNASSLSLNNLQESLLQKRFRMMTDSQKHHAAISILLIVISLGIFIESYCFTIRGYGVPDEVNDSKIFSLMEENSYAIINDNGTYDLYFNGEYLDTVDSLKEYENTHIYKENIIK